MMGYKVDTSQSENEQRKDIMPVKATTGMFNSYLHVDCVVDCVKKFEGETEGNVTRSFKRKGFAVKGYDVFFEGIRIGYVESDRVETQYSSGGVKWCTHTTEATRWNATPAIRSKDVNGRTFYSRLDHGTRKQAITDLLDTAIDVGTLKIVFNEYSGTNIVVNSDDLREAINLRPERGY